MDIFTLSYDYAFPQEFENSSEEGNFQEFFTDLNLPIPVGKHAIVTGFQYENFGVSLVPGAGRQGFTSFMLKAGMNFNISDKWTNLTILLPKFAGADFSDGTFQFGVYSVFGYQKTEHFKYKFGVYTNTELFGPFIVPILGLYYQKNKWEANLNLPISFNVNYQLAQNLKLGVDFQGIKKSYGFDGGQYPEFGADDDLYLEKASNEVGLFLQLKTGPIQTQFIAGTSILRGFFVYERGDKNDFTLSAINFGDDRTQLDQNFPNGFILKARMMYRFDIEQ